MKRKLRMSAVILSAMLVASMGVSCKDSSDGRKTDTVSEVIEVTQTLYKQNTVSLPSDYFNVIDSVYTDGKYMISIHAPCVGSDSKIHQKARYILTLNWQILTFFYLYSDEKNRLHGYNILEFGANTPQILCLLYVRTKILTAYLLQLLPLLRNAQPLTADYHSDNKTSANL